MASCYLQHLRPEWSLESAGTAARNGEKASRGARLAVKEFGLDLNSHRSIHVDLKRQADFDRVFALAESHLALLEEGAELLSSVRGETVSIKDPYGGDLEVYRKSFSQIRFYLDALGGKLEV